MAPQIPAPQLIGLSSPSDKHNMPPAAVTPRAVRILNTHKGPEQCFDSSSAYDSYRKTNNGHLIYPTLSGMFFNDSVFSDMQRYYHLATKMVLQKYRRLCAPSTYGEDLQKYSLIRKYKTQENQAVIFTEDTKFHKILLDISGCHLERLSIRVREDSVLIIEGILLNDRSEEVFRHCFGIPNYDAENMTANISQENILMVKVQKKRETTNHNLVRIRSMRHKYY